MSAAKKIKMILAAKGLTMTDLAKLLGTSVGNLSNKMRRDNFSEKELRDIAEVLNVQLDIRFILEDGTTI